MKIIKEGQTGYGYIVEKDGYYDRLIKENNEIIKEAKAKPKTFLENPYIFCVLQKYGIENRNRRIYPKEILIPAVESYMENVKRRSSVGTVDHEDSTNISLQQIGLLIEDIYWDGATAIGKVKLPITKGYKEMGIASNGADMVANLIFEHDIMIGISSRGVGEVQEMKDKKIYVTEYDLICWDWVQMPSTIGAWAYMNPEPVGQNIQKEPDFKESLKAKSSKFDKLASYMGINL